MSDFAVLNAKFQHKNGRHFEFSYCQYGIFNLKCRRITRPFVCRNDQVMTASRFQSSAILYFKMNETANVVDQLCVHVTNFVFDCDPPPPLIQIPSQNQGTLRSIFLFSKNYKLLNDCF